LGVTIDVSTYFDISFCNIADGLYFKIFQLPREFACSDCDCMLILLCAFNSKLLA
jgi:hypothetical protein